MIRIGIISDRRYVVYDPGGRWECESFTISPTDLSFRQIFHSAFATPARYLQEIYFRLRMIGEGEPQSLLVFNPLFQLSHAEIWLVLAELSVQPGPGEIVVIADQDDKPLCYVFPLALTDDDIQYLALLSTVDAELDTKLCARLFHFPTRQLNVARVSVPKVQHNGFIYEENLSIYHWVAVHALATLGTRGRAGRQAIPIAAIMPHHAGDVLFFCLAWRLVPNAVVSVAVNQAYRAIVEDNADSIGLIPLDIPLINRSPEFRQGQVTPEGTYFTTVAQALPGGHFYVYLRPSRDYNVSRFHLIDHYAFALGRHIWHAGDLLTRDRPLSMPNPVDTVLNLPTKVILFFDGGWTLKIYPYKMQRELIALLRSQGCQITVLSAGNQEYPDCRMVSFESYFQLKALLQEQHIMVGMDSFPTHLAAHVLGLPTICLFGSTRPENSDAPQSSHYHYLEKGLNCRPCYGIAKCPLYRGNDCANFALPSAVVQTINDMLNDLEVSSYPVAAGRETLAETQPVLVGDTRSSRSIDLSQSKAKMPFYAIVVMVTPSFAFVRQIIKEFVTSLKRDGWHQTYLRSRRYLQRKIIRRHCG